MTKTVRRWHMFVETYSLGSKEVSEVEPAEMDDGEWVKYEDIKHLLESVGEPGAEPIYRAVSNEDRILTQQELKNAWVHVHGDAAAQADVAGHIRALQAERASRPEPEAKPGCDHNPWSIDCTISGWVTFKAERYRQCSVCLHRVPAASTENRKGDV